MTFERFCQTQGAARVLVKATVAPLDWPQLRRLVDPRWVALAERPDNLWFHQNTHRWFGTTRPVARALAGHRNMARAQIGRVVILAARGHGLSRGE